MNSNISASSSAPDGPDEEEVSGTSVSISRTSLRPMNDREYVTLNHKTVH